MPEALTVSSRFDQMRSATSSCQYHHIRGALDLELGGKTVPGLKDTSFNDWVGLLQDVMQHFQLRPLEDVDDETKTLVFKCQAKIAHLRFLEQTFSFRWPDLKPALQAFCTALLEKL